MLPKSCMWLAACCLALTFSVASQNLITNGDFEGRTTIGWTFSGFAGAPAIIRFDVTGGGGSNCFSCQPGGLRGNPPFAPYVMEQQVTLTKGETYEFHADVATAANANRGNFDAGTFEVLVDGTIVDSWSAGGVVAGETKRDKLCARFVAARSGRQGLRITFHRRFLSATDTPTCHIDNMRLLLASGQPTLCVTGERRIGSTTPALGSVLGSPRSPVAIYYSFLSTTPVTVPGILGTLELGTPFALFVAGNTDSSGVFRFRVSIPSGVPAGLTVTAQALETTLLGPALSHGLRISAYR